ncbi:chorismate mutase [Streptomyces sp. NPDC003327]
MAVRAVRGAVRPDRDEAGRTHARVQEPLTAVPDRSGCTAVGVPLVRAQELDARYEGDPPPCDRTHRTPQALPFGQTALLSGHDPAHVETDLPTSRTAPVHPGAAAALRKDIAP